MRRDELGAEGARAVQAMPSLTRMQSCSIWSGGTGQDASNGAHPRQGEVMNQVQGPSWEPSQEQWETGLKTRLAPCKVQGPSRRQGWIGPSGRLWQMLGWRLILLRDSSVKERKPRAGLRWSS